MDSERTEVYRDLWFDDGNLVIQTGLALFRVHKGVLCFHSSVLRDMASFPASASFDTYEGAQLAAFPYDAQDMHHFLRALYVPDYFLPPPEMTTFEILEGVLRLAHKYDVPSLRRRALRHMARRERYRTYSVSHVTGPIPPPAASLWAGNALSSSLRSL
ncbi:hypothetical protein EV122DRAFT_218863 [Schizophyllum commune]